MPSTTRLAPDAAAEALRGLAADLLDAWHTKNWTHVPLIELQMRNLAANLDGQGRR